MVVQHEHHSLRSSLAVVKRVRRPPRRLPGLIFFGSIVRRLRRDEDGKKRRHVAAFHLQRPTQARQVTKNDWDADQLMRSSLRLYDTPDCRNLLVVGPGVLGSLVCQKWLEMFPAAIVVGQTNSTKNHER